MCNNSASRGTSTRDTRNGHLVASEPSQNSSVLFCLLFEVSYTFFQPTKVFSDVYADTQEFWNMVHVVISDHCHRRVRLVSCGSQTLV